jgi:hypothetical protein
MRWSHVPGREEGFANDSAGGDVGTFVVIDVRPRN